VKAMHNKEPLWQALADLHACPTFQDVCSQIEQLALDGERTAFSHESVQRSHFHDASGISSLLSRQPGPLSHYQECAVLLSDRTLLQRYCNDYVNLDPECAGTSAKDSLHWMLRGLASRFRQMRRSASRWQSTLSLSGYSQT
jgi:hypothetical protein